MTLTLLWFPTAEESIFLSVRIAGTDGLLSRPPLDASSFEKVEKLLKVVLICLFWLDQLLRILIRILTSEMWRDILNFAVRTTHIFRLAGFPSLAQTVNILLLFVLLMLHHDMRHCHSYYNYMKKYYFWAMQDGSRGC